MTRETIFTHQSNNLNHSSKISTTLKSVRNGENTWQNLYEDWYLLGPEDRKWEEYEKGFNKNF